MVSPLSIKKFLLSLSLILGIIVNGLAFAEDVEIFANENPPSEPNILVLLDNSGSMNELMPGSSETRMDALSAAFETFISNPEIKDMNIGLMAFSNGSDEPRPHGVSVPVTDIDTEIMPIMLSNILPGYLSRDDIFGFFSLADDNLPDPTVGQSVRQYLPDVIRAWRANGETPMVDALHEAALYFKGMSPKWGAASAEQVNAAHPSSYDGGFTSTLSRVPSGSTTECFDSPTCGESCRLSTLDHHLCGVGEMSCWTGRSCFTERLDRGYRCELGSRSACEALDPRFSCSLEVGRSCTRVCSGPLDVETGACLSGEVEECTESTFYQCNYEEIMASCLRETYECDELIDAKRNVGSARYISPIKKECQNNTILLMTDGVPNMGEKRTEAEETRREIRDLTGSGSACIAIPGQVLPVVVGNTLADGRCGPELVKHLAVDDQSDSVEGENVVKTYTVGFALEDGSGAKTYLELLAENGGGKYFSANDSAALADAFLEVAYDSSPVARSFSAPVYTVDPNSMISHSDDIYLPLFKSSSLPRWYGNIKKFKLSDDGQIIDATGSPAIDSTGRLRVDAVDFWMPRTAVIPEGLDPVTIGGAANNLIPDSRNLLIDRGDGLINLSYANVSKTQLGDAGMSDAHKSSLINFIRGLEEDGSTPRLAMGDILHSKPTLISYGTQQVLFFGTNEGFLHAIDAADASDGGGTEKFAFMPSSLLGNIDGQLTNEKSADGELKRIYGVDGSITAHIRDINKNGKVDAADGDIATLIFGLRRGGSEYYALDVTNPDSPRLKWKISKFGAFSNLGETWSKPVPAKLRFLESGREVFKEVLVFGGGYDNRLDLEDPSARGGLASASGNGVYIVDMESGEHVWSYTNGALNNSIPGNIRTMDVDGDGSIERLYFGDTGGNLWRVDLNAYDSLPGRRLYDVANNAKLTQIASLGGAGADPRKFFFAPEVSMFKHAGEEVLLLSVGSGYRSHPLNETIDDRFYIVRDENVRTVPPSTEPVITDADLMPASALAGDGFLPGNNGWYIPLLKGSGEKVLASPMIFMNKVIFTTFAISPESVGAVDEHDCAVSSSYLSSVYVLDLMSGAATVDLNNDGEVDDEDMSTTVENGDILDTPQLVFNKPKNCTDDGCDQFVDIRVGNKSIPIVHETTIGGGNNLGEFLPKVYWINP